MARVVEASVNYTAPMAVRPRYHAQDHARDNLVLDPQVVPIEDLRGAAEAPSLEREGFALVPHRSAVGDFRDPEAVKRLYHDEVARLVRRMSGADAVAISGSGILRFGERSADCGQYFNSQPARFIHVDISDPTARAFAARARPEAGRAHRFAHFNIWRAISSPPQDVPLALCDARSVAPADLVTADAVFDSKDAPEWSFEGLVVRHNPAHRWCYFSDMTRDEVLIFKTNDSADFAPHCVPHSAFDDPSCPAGVPPRMSIEMRAVAFWD